MSDRQLQQLRQIQLKNTLAFLTESQTVRRSASSTPSAADSLSIASETTAAPTSLTSLASSEPMLLAAQTYSGDWQADATAEWISNNQNASPFGLVNSFPLDWSPPFNQGFTYDQAVTGITMLKNGNYNGAQRLMDFYLSQWTGSGFWTVYNTQNMNGPRQEWERIMGPNAWIGIFALHHYQATGDTRSLDLATNVGRWIRSLPHRDGGVAMGAGGTFWGNIYSVENNLSYYGFAKLLSTMASGASDREAFTGEAATVKNWVRTLGYDAGTGLFRRGGYGDSIQALDTNAWALLAFGPQTLQNEFGIDPAALAANIERTFAVQNNGTFGGNVMTAKGFDFSDASNAARIRRPGMKWMEGTNHMILAYQQLASYYASSNPTLSSQFQSKANYFKSRNSWSGIGDNFGWSYYYADRADAVVFSDNPYWKTTGGTSAASSSWVFFSHYDINPFAIG